MEFDIFYKMKYKKIVVLVDNYEVNNLKRITTLVNLKYKDMKKRKSIVLVGNRIDTTYERQKKYYFNS